MKNARIQVMVWFFMTISVIATYRIITNDLHKPAAEIVHAQNSLEIEKIALERDRIRQLERDRLQLQRSHLKRNADLWFYGTAGLFSSVSLSIFIIAAGIHRARVKRASVHTYRIGQYNEVVVHERDLSLAAPVAMGLMNAEQLKQMNGGIDKAFQLYSQMADVQTRQIRALVGRKGIGLADSPDLAQPTLPAAGTPTFADLLQAEQIAPGKPLILGYYQGQPEHRDIKALKSLAVAGRQGSGKTVSMGYLLASTLLAYNAQIYVIDPHKGHDEGLYLLIQPLEQTGRVTVINPFDTPQLIAMLNTTLDRRLRGDESSNPAILLVIDELARLADLECFDTLIKFLERCTGETRKANITFVGGSTKWTARHFKGRADIRACMNSALVHKTKPSQAELLLEDSQEKKLVKQLQQPGDAILVTDFADTRLVRMPFCTRTDMETVARMVGNSQHAMKIVTPGVITPVPAEKQRESTDQQHPETPVITTKPPTFGDVVRGRLADINLSQNKLAELVEISKKDMSEYLNGKRNIPEALQTRILQVLEKIQKQRNAIETQPETDTVTDTATSETQEH